MPRDGLPNYFDDQRFGSVGFSGGFIARAWLAGDHEQALRLAIAEPNPADRPDTKQEKAILREFWGNWPEAKARLERSHARSLVTYLADHPVDFRGAFARVRRELRSLYFSAYQSHLWNLTLGRMIERADPARAAGADRLQGRHPADPPRPRHRPGRRSSPPAGSPCPPRGPRCPPTGPEREAALEVVAAEGFAWEDLRVKHLKDVFFSKGTRPALFFAENLTHALADDELEPGRKKLRLEFELPKGAYATLVVKRVTDAA